MSPAPGFIPGGMKIVGAVFAGLGYRVRVTSYSGDDDIDVFVFDGADDHLTGVCRSNATRARFRPSRAARL